MITSAVSEHHNILTSEPPCQAIWNNCLKLIQSSITPQSFQTWFLPIKPVKLDGSALTIEVPSLFFYEWLEEYYVHLLKQAINQELGPHGRLEYSVIVDQGSMKNEPLTMKVRNNAAPTPPPVVKKSLAPSAIKAEQAKERDPKRTLQSSPFEMPLVDPVLTESQLKSNYVFENFIEGDCNRLARAAGLAISDKPGTTSFNPLMIYGGVGIGKTHLAQAIGNEIKSLHPNCFVLYVTSEQFTAQFIEALRTNTVQQFTNYYMQVDALIVDDVQFLAKKEKTQEHFFHIFNHLHQAGKQIVMTSDQAPKSIEGLQERLLSRFKWGLTADMQTPGLETRMAIVHRKLMAEGMIIPDEVIEYIAFNVDTNIRELEGVIVSLAGQASFLKRDIDLELAKRTLINIIKHTKDRKLTVEYVQQIVAEYFNLSIADLKSDTRKKEIAMARQIAMYFSKEYTDIPLKIIGDRFGGRDHSTVVHASKAVIKKSESDTFYSKMLTDLQEQLKSNG